MKRNILSLIFIGLLFGGLVPTEVGDTTHEREINININIDVYVNITINIIEVEEEMKFFQFKYRNDSQSNRKPIHSNLLWETSAGVIYMVPSDDLDIIIYSSDKGVTWTDVSNMHNNDGIGSFYPDESDNKLWFGDGIEGEIRSQHISYVTLSTNAVTLGDTHGADLTDHDTILFDVNTQYSLLLQNSTNWNLFAYELTPDFVDSQDTGDDPLKAADVTYGVVVGAYHYFLYKHADTNVELWRYEVGANGWTIDSLGANTDLPSTKNQYGMSYDGVDKLYFVVKDTADSNKIKLWSYTISTDILIQIAEYDICIMLDRFNSSTGDTPNSQEKAFENGGTKIYKFSRSKSNINLLQDIADSPNFTASSTILGITDNFLFVDNSGTVEIWEQQDVLGDEITFAIVTRTIQEFSTAQVRGTIKFSTNQIIELYDNDTTVR